MPNGDNIVFIEQNGNGNGSGTSSTENAEKQIQSLSNVRYTSINGGDTRMADSALEGVRRVQGAGTEFLALCRRDAISRGDTRLADTLHEKAQESIRRGL